MVKSLFRSPQLGEVIFQTVHKLKIQRLKLEQVTFRLRERDRVLFETCAMAIRKKNKERAIICANESAEVKKLLNLVMQSQLAIERIILRLETLRELSDVIIDLKPALRALQSVAKHLVEAMPDVASELEKLNDSISETLSITNIRSPQPLMPFEMRTPGSEEILREVSTLLEQKLTRELPEPPASLITPEKVEPAESVREMIPLATGCPGPEAYRQGEPQTTVSYEDVKMQSLSFTIQRSSSLEDILLEYTKRCRGRINVAQCALELNVPSNDVLKALENLGEQGKIKIER
ncbi:MAG: hypothetical protein AOA65_0113 [Candidatus Bathyarchaeota archaeon BA1]|nr:MAG: hypothetical protein AOA65_0113 [Candidatus Bathyarchaeota archaeon BA1]